MKWPTSERMDNIARNGNDGLHYEEKDMLICNFDDVGEAILEAEYQARVHKIRVSVVSVGDSMRVMSTTSVRDKSKILETIKPL